VPRWAVHAASAVVLSLRDQIEAVIRLEARTQWLIEPPSILRPKLLVEASCGAFTTIPASRSSPTGMQYN
jgi:hypothetical protein